MNLAGVAPIEFLRDHAAHGQADYRRPRHGEMRDHLRDIGTDIVERQRAVKIVAVAVTTDIERHGAVMRAQLTELRRPVLPVATDPVHEHDEMSGGAGHVDRNTWLRANESARDYR